MRRMPLRGLSRSGAADGEVATWDDSTDQWVPVPAESAVDLFLDQGDLLVGTGAGTAEVLPVGAPGQVLIPDPTEPTGLRWASFLVAGDSIVVTETGEVVFT
jgi:hypothetical protein